MNYALIGCGRIAVRHLSAALACGLQPAALCDCNPLAGTALLEQVAFQGPTPRFYQNHLDLLRREQPTLVAITTESGSHAQIALDCIAAGCHLLIEKPIALSVRDANAIIAAAKQKGVLVCPCHQNRFNPSVLALRKALENGRFGKLSHGSIHVRWNRGDAYYSQADWRGTWERDGGALMNQAIHGIDLLRWLLGEDVTQVFAYTRRRLHQTVETEDVGLAVLQFSSGVIATVEGTTNVYPKNLEQSLCIFGEKGTVKLGGLASELIQVWDFSDFDGMDMLHKAGLGRLSPDIYGRGHEALYRDVLDAIATHREPFVSPQAGKQALETVLAIYKSAFLGEAVSLPLIEGGTTDFKGQFAE